MFEIYVVGLPTEQQPAGFSDVAKWLSLYSLTRYISMNFVQVIFKSWKYRVILR